jgi:hypothetical protein
MRQFKDLNSGEKLKVLDLVNEITKIVDKEKELTVSQGIDIGIDVVNRILKPRANGYLPKIEYWTSKLVNHMTSQDLDTKKIEYFNNKIAYFEMKQSELTNQNK